MIGSIDYRLFPNMWTAPNLKKSEDLKICYFHKQRGFEQTDTLKIYTQHEVNKVEMNQNKRNYKISKLFYL